MDQRPVVLGQPYCFIGTITRVGAGLDGKILTTVSITRRMRDTKGRLREELGTIRDGTFDAYEVKIYDPATRVSTLLYPKYQSAYVVHVPLPAPRKGPALLAVEDQPRLSQMRATTDVYKKDHPDVVRAMTPKVEDLGPKTIEGVYVEGKRESGWLGGRLNDPDALEVEEWWTSPDLKLTLASSGSSAASGKLTMTVSNLSRAEPAEELFHAPPDYSLKKR